MPLWGLRLILHLRKADPASGCVRSFSSKADTEQLGLHGIRHGSFRPRLVPFRLGLEEAQTAFERWQSGHWLAPNRVLGEGTSAMRPVLLPLWCFEATMQIEYSGSLGFPTGDKTMMWKDSGWKQIERRQYLYTHPDMQVCATYKYRPDLVEAAKVPGLLGRARVVSRLEAETMTARASVRDGEPVPIDAPVMKQAIAWEFVLRNVRRTERKLAEETLKLESGADDVSEVKVRLFPFRRRCRIIYVPAFVVDYVHGELYNEHGERMPQRFQAVISGFGEGSVAAERHFSPQKVQAAAATTIGGLGLMGSLVAYPLMGLPPPSLLSPDTAFMVFIVCSAAGFGARAAPQVLREMAETSRIRQEDADFERITAQGLGPMDMLDDDMEVVRMNSEWRRWEEADKWHWDEVKRKRWAEGLWRAQHLRRLRKAELLALREAAAARQRYEEEMEARRTAKWGRGSHHHRFAQNAGFSGQQEGGQRDVLGYYALLGLDAGRGADVTETTIKRAFREAALQWHPDQQQSDDKKEQARERFQKVKAAYEVLKDPELKRQYDRGQAVAL